MARPRHAPLFVGFGGADPGQNRLAWRVTGRKGLLQTFIDLVFAPIALVPIALVDVAPGRLVPSPNRRLLSRRPPDGPGLQGLHAAL
jgi:hypothetical protein